jgi:transcription elongation factor Elf1
MSDEAKVIQLDDYRHVSEIWLTTRIKCLACGHSSIRTTHENAKISNIECWKCGATTAEVVRVFKRQEKNV